MYSICIFLNTNFNKKKHFFHIFKPCLIKFPARMKAAAASVTIIPPPYPHYYDMVLAFLAEVHDRATTGAQWAFAWSGYWITISGLSE